MDTPPDETPESLRLHQQALKVLGRLQDGKITFAEAAPILRQLSALRRAALGLPPATPVAHGPEAA